MSVAKYWNTISCLAPKRKRNINVSYLHKFMMADIIFCAATEHFCKGIRAMAFGRTTTKRVT